MAQYKVQHNQTIWDIALILYGSIEGAFDLFMSNPKLTMTTDLRAGDILEYHEGFQVNPSIIEGLEKRDIVPANGERHVYAKDSQKPLRAIGFIPFQCISVSFAVAGDGVMIVDWGDNSDLQTVVLGSSDRFLEHYFNNKVDERRIRLYGDFSLSHLNLSDFTGTLRPVGLITVDQFTSVSNYGNLVGLKLFQGVTDINLQYSQLDDLSPIYEYGQGSGTYTGLKSLDLRYAKFKDNTVLENYLSWLAGATTHGLRRPCTIYVDEATDAAKDSMATILQEPSWNQDGFGDDWKFYINEQLYTPQ